MANGVNGMTLPVALQHVDGVQNRAFGPVTILHPQMVEINVLGRDMMKTKDASSHNAQVGV